MAIHLALWKTAKPPAVRIYRGKLLDEPGRAPGKREEELTTGDRLSLVNRDPGSPPECQVPVHDAAVVLPEPGERTGQTVPHGEADTPPDAAQGITPDEVRPSVNGRMPSLAQFWTFLEAAGRGTATIREYRWDAGWWERHAQRRGHSVYTVNVSTVEAILTGVHPATARRKLAFLRGFAKWLLREGYPNLHEEVGKVLLPRLPTRLPDDKGAQTFVQLREQARHWCHEGKREGIWVGLMLMGGVRVSEIASAWMVGSTVVKVVGKGLKERLVPIPSWLGAAMTTHRRSGRGGWAQERRVIWRAMRIHQIGKPHALRHTYASELLRRGKPIEEVKVLLGHESISTTILYTHVTIPHDAADLLDR